MPTIKGRKNQVIAEFSNKKWEGETVVLKDCEGCTIENSDFTGKQKDYLFLSDCKKCIVQKCKFHDKKTIGLFMKIQGGKSNGNIVRFCEFTRHTYKPKPKKKGENAEMLRIGNSETSGCLFNTTVENCWFHDNAADPETISIKSCGNNIIHNLFENNKSNVTIRHGGFNKYISNIHRGSGGIRVIGQNNEIRANQFLDNRDTGKFYPIILAYADVETDPNFNKDGQPKGKKASKGHAKYARVKNCIIEDNIFQNCAKTIGEKKDKKLKPENNTIQNNKEGKVTMPSRPPTEERERTVRSEPEEVISR